MVPSQYLRVTNKEMKARVATKKPTVQDKAIVNKINEKERSQFQLCPFIYSCVYLVR